ncbi:MAG TPA: hypothetical protein VHG28_25125 [Longimicrobiaceae bacterium]|nr:hypothetical protein [Longimicrobiaceae bacterium]
MDPAALTPHRRGVGAALLFLGSAALAGAELLETGIRYSAPGVVEGVFALLLTYLLLLRGAWIRPPGALGWVPVAYGTAANTMLLELLLPPPGVIEWVVVFALAFTAWGALATGTRTRLMAALASLALLLALLKFSVIPVLWERVGPAPGEAFGLGDVAESVRRVLADHRPIRPAGQLAGIVALSLWVLATRLLWDPVGAEPATGGEVLPGEPAEG